jgi:hypothetical protein
LIQDLHADTVIFHEYSSLLVLQCVHARRVLSRTQGYAGNPYDLGTARKNFEAVFGENPWFWFLPTAPTSYLGDGFFLSPHSHNGHAGFVSVDSQSSQSTAIRMDDSAADDGQSPPTDASLLV